MAFSNKLLDRPKRQDGRFHPAPNEQREMRRYPARMNCPTRKLAIATPVFVTRLDRFHQRRDGREIVGKMFHRQGHAWPEAPDGVSPARNGRLLGALDIHFDEVDMRQLELRDDLVD